MKYLFLILALCTASHGQMLQSIINDTVVAGAGSFSLTQLKFWDSASGGTGGGTCASTGTTCAVTVTAVGASHGIICFGLGVGGTARTLTSCTFSGETLTHCATAGATKCSGNPSASGEWGDAWYSVSSVGGATTVTCNWSGATGGYNACGVLELSYSGPSISFDTSGSVAVSSCTSCTGVALTLTGTNDAIFTFGAPDNNFTNINGSYTNPKQFYSGSLEAGALNTGSGSAPTVTQNVSGNGAIIALAFKGN